MKATNRQTGTFFSCYGSSAESPSIFGKWIPTLTGPVPDLPGRLLQQVREVQHRHDLAVSEGRPSCHAAKL
jgi:hypothetical protein